MQQKQFPHHQQEEEEEEETLNRLPRHTLFQGRADPLPGTFPWPTSTAEEGGRQGVRERENELRNYDGGSFVRPRGQVINTQFVIMINFRNFLQPLPPFTACVLPIRLRGTIHGLRGWWAPRSAGKLPRAQSG